MKIRTDFVSNSSSCSFVIEDPKDAISLFNRCFGDSNDIPYCFADALECSLHGKKESLEKIKDFVGYGQMSDLYDGSHEYELYDISLQSILCIPMNLLEDVSSIHISTDSYHEGNVMFLKLLKAFFDNAGIKTNDDGDFSCGLNDDDFMVKLIKKIFNERKNENEDKI